MQYAELTWDHDEKEHQSFLEKLAPIVLFTYNRLDHTRQTIEALQKNVYAADSQLIIYSDGPKNEAAEEKVAAVRAYSHTIQGFKTVTIIERPENWGLARNIIDGVTNIVNKYGKIIVLEDDIVTSKWFLKYMNDALVIYQYEKEVMMINGYIYPMDKAELPETFFVKIGGCWGWSTWKNRWEYFSRNPKRIREGFSSDDIYHFNLEGYALSRFGQIEQNYLGQIYTWAIFWDAAVFRHGLSLNSRVSLSNNCGMDGTGEHCSVTNILDAVLTDTPVRQFPLAIKEDKVARKRMACFLHTLEYIPWWRKAARNIVNKCLSARLIRLIKEISERIRG